jgi:hypothetical protein
MLIGFLLAFSTLGFEISKITIMLSALGVGIGFDLAGLRGCGVPVQVVRPGRSVSLSPLGLRRQSAIGQFIPPRSCCRGQVPVLKVK